MREYAGFLTGLTTALIAADCLIAFTQMEFFHLVFAAMMIATFAMGLFGVATEPKKRKAHWERSGGLDVMIMGRRYKK